MPDDAIARLTANEKECLRRRLLPQTAKEMAIDLGISPHAVEKRLKMARAKLGQSSSLAAARMLADVEGYQRLVPARPDLSSGSNQRDEDRVALLPPQAEMRPRLHKGSLMLAALFLVALVQDVPTPGVEAPSLRNGKGEAVAARKVGMDEAAAFISMGFRHKDADRSGYLDAREASEMEPRDVNRDTSLPPAPPVGAPDLAGERKWMKLLDNDRDGRVSENEYVTYMMPWTLYSGVPADWHREETAGKD